MSTRKRAKASKALENIVVKPSSLGALLESIRVGEEMSQVEFSRRLGISRSHLCDIEKGRKTISVARAARFAGILGYSEAQFVRLSLQGLVEESGLKLKVRVDAA
jgi:transcriptional regulator with XRE-family HTH domain